MICRAVSALIDPLRKVHLGNIGAWHNRIPIHKYTVLLVGIHFLTVWLLTILRPFGRQPVAWRQCGCHCRTVGEPCSPFVSQPVDLDEFEDINNNHIGKVYSVLTWSKACHLIAIFEEEPISHTGSIELFR